MIRALAAAVALSLLAAPAAHAAEAKKKKIDLVLALDTSNSMDGLINSAKARLWDVVNELARAQPQPELRVALYTYGNDSYDARSGFVRKESDFTKDLDALYSKLNAVTTNGGSEYVARVTKAAVEELAWDDSKDSLKILFVAGNEAATQDPENDVQKVAKAAIAKGIMVNTIFCGAASSGEADGWAQVAKAADGKFAVIDQEAGTRVASTPMDAKLATLSQKLNETYVAYGRKGAEKKEMQRTGDEAAASMGAGVAASRAAAKSTALYDSSEWDLVDAKKDGAKVENVPAEQLPEPMRAMSGKEREAYVDGMAKKRADIQKEIASVNAERDEYLKKEAAKSKAKSNGTDGLDTAMKNSIREQATSKGFTFAK